MNYLERPLIIRTNYGDESIALTQWAFESHLLATVVYIDTGFQAQGWQKRVKLGEAHAKACGFETVKILSAISFRDAVIGRKAFPCSKFQWCTALLKGLPFLDWLEKRDLKGESIILLAKRKAASKAHMDLSEWIEFCEYHNDRTVWHPLIDMDDKVRDALLSRAHFAPLGHRSLECEPCVNATPADFKRMSPQDKARLKDLEKTIQIAFQAPSEEPTQYLDLFYRGCGNHFGCGL